jgi:hypothetical protein
MGQKWKEYVRRKVVWVSLVTEKSFCRPVQGYMSMGVYAVCCIVSPAFSDTDGERGT